MNLRSILTALIASTAALHAQQPGITAETWTGLTPGKSILILRKEHCKIPGKLSEIL